MRAEKKAASDAPQEPPVQEGSAETPAEPPREDERSVVNITDPQAIRALAHKVRLDVIDELFGSEETYTATELARSFGLTPSAMSYHLRALEKWGYVVRAESSSDGRERHWKAAGDSLNVGDKSNVSELVSSTLIDVTLNATRERVLKALVQADSLGEDDRRTLMLASSKIRLTKEEAKVFAEEYHLLVDKYRKLKADPAQVGRREQMHLTTIFVPEVSDQT